MSFGVTYKLKDLFFDRAHVQKQTMRLGMRFLSRAGARVRLRARRSLRRRKKISAPGTPPSVHSTDSVATLKNILYAYDNRNASVVIGPVRLNQVNDLTGGGRIGVPELMEMGGTTSILEVSGNQGKNWRRFDRRRSPRPWEIFRRRQAVYPPRPFMGPALEAEAPKFPGLWGSAA